MNKLWIVAAAGVMLSSACKKDSAADMITTDKGESLGSLVKGVSKDLSDTKQALVEVAHEAKAIQSQVQVPADEAAKACTVSVTKVTDKGPEYEMTNAGTRELNYCNAIVYGYDKDGKQVSKVWLRPLGDKDKPATLHAGDKVTGLLDVTEFSDPQWEAAKKLAKEPGASFEAVVISVHFVGGQEWFEPKRAPDQRPKGGG